MLIVDAYRNLMDTSVEIAARFHVSNTYAHEVYLLQKYRWTVLTNQSSIHYHNEPRMDPHFRCLMNTFDYEDALFRYVGSGATAFNGSSWVASGNSLAGKYQPVYNLCARSIAGVNNASKNKEFFNYVVASGHGAGAFLNKHNSINIPGLNNIDDLAALFNLSDGWCGGLDAFGSGCHSHTGACNAITKASCRPISQGGKATDKDVMCIQLHRNSTAEEFLLSNESIKNAYGIDASKSDTWQYRHRIKHMGLTGNQAPSSVIPVDAIRAVGGSLKSTGKNRLDPIYAENDSISGTMTKELGHHTQAGLHDGGIRNMISEAVIDLNVLYQNCNSPQKVAITFWASDEMNNNMDEFGQITTTWSASNPNIILTEGQLGYGNETYYYIGDEKALDYFGDPERGDRQRYTYKSYVFDISNLTGDELKTGWIKIAQPSTIHASEGDEYGGVGPFHIATVWDKINNCDIYGHDYQTTADQVKWSSDYKTATITYYCNNNKKEEPQPYKAVSTAVKSADGKRITYTVTGYKGETFTKIVSSSASGAGVINTVNLNGKVQGNNTDSDSSNSVVYPAGSKSDRIYKLADSYIKFTIPSASHSIPAGTQKVQFSYYYSEKLQELNIQIYDSRGRTIGQGGIGYASTFNNPSNGYVTIPLIRNSNEDLADAYVVVTGKSQTQNWSSASGTPSTAHSSIGITQMKLYF